MTLSFGGIVFIIGVVMLVGSLGFVLYSLAFGSRTRLEKRIQHVLGTAAPHKNAKGRNLRKEMSEAQARRRQLHSRLKGKDPAHRKSGVQKLEERLAQAGLQVGIRKYFLFSGVFAAVAALSVLIGGMPPVFALFVTVICGLGVPHLVVASLVGRRQKKFTTDFADAIDVIVRGIRSGLPLGECINLIGREMADPVGTEFRLMAEAQRLGVTMEEALGRMVARVPTPEVKFFAIVLSIQQQTGGNLAETLSKLSEVLRGRKRMRDKAAAMSSEAKSSAGIIGSLPIVVGGLLGVVAPDYLSVLFTTDTGHMLLGISAAIMGVGIFVMRQMINFDI